MKIWWELPILFTALFLGCSRPDIPENRVFTVNDLGHKTVGVVIGNTAETFASDFGGDSAKINVERFKSLDDAVQSLRQGSLDAVLCDEGPASVYVNRNPSLKILDEAFREENYAGVVAKQNWGLLDTVNMALIQMRAMGVYDSILNRYVTGEGEYRYLPKEKATGPVLKLATSSDFPPYEFRSDSGIVEGIDIEIARYIADFMERPLEIIDMGFDSIFDAVNTGKADLGLAAFSVTEEREQVVTFTDHYAKSRIVVMVRSGEQESTFQRIKDTLLGY